MVRPEQPAPVKIVILDRDGVINEDSPDYIKSPAEWTPIPGSIQAIAKLSKAGIRVAIATNQSGLARGFFDTDTLSLIHHKLSSMVKDLGGVVDGVFYCPHAPEDKCYCRKPATGLLKQIESVFDCSLVGCFFIGDSNKDMLAATTHGCRPVLVRTGNGTDTERELLRQGELSFPVFDDLAQAVEQLLIPDHAI